MAYGDTGALAVFGSGKALAREPMAVGSRTRNRQAQVDAIWVDCTGSHKVVPYIRNSGVVLGMAISVRARPSRYQRVPASVEALMLRRQRRKNTLPLEGDYESSAFSLVGKGPTPEEALAKKELRSTVMKAISQLRKSLRTVILPREIRGLTSVETASASA
jgi:hypothetical protein